MSLFVALTNERVTVVSLIEYFGVVLAYVMDLFWFRMPVDYLKIVGSVMIVASCIFISFN